MAVQCVRISLLVLSVIKGTDKTHKDLHVDYIQLDSTDTG